MQWALENYLDRYAAPRAHVRRVLLRKLDRSLAHHGGDRDQVAQWIEEALDAAERSGILDDKRYARDRARSLLRQGNGEAKIIAKLMAKGLMRAEVEQALAEIRDTSEFDPQLIAAAAFAYKKRLGCLRRPDRESDTRREIAKMARAGFPYALVRRVLEMDEEELEELAFARRFL